MYQFTITFQQILFTSAVPEKPFSSEDEEEQEWKASKWRNGIFIIELHIICGEIAELIFQQSKLLALPIANSLSVRTIQVVKS